MKSYPLWLVSTAMLMLCYGTFASSQESECQLPLEVRVPPNWIVEYRGATDTLRYSDSSIHLDWDEVTKSLMIDGNPYPVRPSMSDFDLELNALMRRAQREFHDHLAHRFIDGVSFESASAVSDAEKEEAAINAARILQAHPFVDSTGVITHLSSMLVRLEVFLEGRGEVGVIFNPMEAEVCHTEPEFTIEKACKIANRLANLRVSEVPKVYILQGGGSTTHSGSPAQDYHDQVR